jgi:primosomal protein N' (replication factor Y) (superfamily II helicase)
MDRTVARVAVDLPLANLDRPFDYAVPAELAESAQPGVRVKVRFAGRLRDGFVLERVTPGERTSLSPLHKVVSPQPVLSEPVAALIRNVADHYAGSFADVVRAAVPPRHATTEKATTTTRPEPVIVADHEPVLRSYPAADGFLKSISEGGAARAAWTVAPTTAPIGDWARGFAEAAALTLAGGRSAILLAPDASQLQRMVEVCTQRFGAGSFAVLAADAGPSARYRNFLGVIRGQTRLVLGTRAAVFAPVDELGLIALWDDGNDSYAEPHAPYWHAREVAALRAHSQRCALLVAAHNRTAEVQQLVAKGWLAPLALAPSHARRECAAIRPSAQTSARDPFAEISRLPREAFEAIRRGLIAGPVLVQVPRAGYLPILVCGECRLPARCPKCSQTLADPSGAGPTCRWCGPVTAWHCPECGGRSLRSPVIGVARTAEELGKAFPGTAVIQSSGERKILQIPDRPALVLATPGAAPDAMAGYAATVLLDAELMLARPDLRAGEESLRRWLAVVAKVRPGADGGTVLVVGPAALREVQALVRLDPVGYAEAELQQRKEAGFPPAVKLVSMEGPGEALAAALSKMELPDHVQVLGPFPIANPGGDDLSRVTLRCALPVGAHLVKAVKAMQSVRSAHKNTPLRVRVDPQVME